MLQPSLSTKIIDDAENIDILDNSFNKLGDLAVSSTILAPSLRKYWLTSFVRSYGGSRQLAVTVISKNNLPKLIIPLQRKNDVSLEFLCDETSDYNDFFYGEIDAELVKYALLYWRARGIQKIRLNRLPSESKTIDLLRVIGLEMNWEVKIYKCDSLPIVITQPEKELQDWSGVKKHAIKRYKRKQNTLSKMFEVSFAYVETEAQLKGIFPEVQRLHIARWKSNGIRSKYLDPRRESFVIDVCKGAIRDGTLFFPIMKIDGNLASFIIGFKSEDSIFDWNTSFSIDYYRWSPGALLLLHVLSQSKENNCRRYNLMRGIEPHKFLWTDFIDHNLTVEINM